LKHKEPQEKQRRKIETGHSDVENINPSQWTVKMDPVIGSKSERGKCS